MHTRRIGVCFLCFTLIEIMRVSGGSDTFLLVVLWLGESCVLEFDQRQRIPCKALFSSLCM